MKGEGKSEGRGESEGRGKSEGRGEGEGTVKEEGEGTVKGIGFIWPFTLQLLLPPSTHQLVTWWVWFSYCVGVHCTLTPGTCITYIQFHPELLRELWAIGLVSCPCIVCVCVYVCVCVRECVCVCGGEKG